MNGAQPGGEWIFGIDGGGTSVRLRAESSAPGNGGEALAMIESVSINPRSVGWDAAERTLANLFSRLYAESGLGAEHCRAGFAGVAGVGRTGDRETMRQIILKASGVECPVAVESDSYPALVGALGGKKGILLIAGTGSIACGFDGEGNFVRSGGWGHILGDEGSAYDVGREGLRAALRFRDGRGAPTLLLDDALKHFGAEEPFALIPAIYERFDKSAVAGFARIVRSARNRGDAVAAEIMERAASELSRLVVSVADRLGSDQADSITVAMTGGFISNDPILETAVAALLEAALPGIRIKKPRADATVGACMLARELSAKG